MAINYASGIFPGDVVWVAADNNIYRSLTRHTPAQGSTFTVGSDWQILRPLLATNFSPMRSVVAVDSGGMVQLDVDPSMIHLNEFAVPNNNIDLGSNLTHRIINSPDPTMDHHVANKNYVDNLSAKMYIQGHVYDQNDLIIFIDQNLQYGVIQVLANTWTAVDPTMVAPEAAAGRVVLRAPDDAGIPQAMTYDDGNGNIRLLRSYGPGDFVWRVAAGSLTEFRIYKCNALGGTGGNGNAQNPSTMDDIFDDVFTEPRANAILEAEVDTLSHRRLEDTPGLPPHVNTYTVQSSTAISRNQAALTYWFPNTHLGGSLAVNSSFSFARPHDYHWDVLRLTYVVC